MDSILAKQIGGAGGGLSSPLIANLDFATYQAVAMVCHKGATVPAAPVEGQWFLHTPTGRKVLMMYDGSDWMAFHTLGTMTVYVDATDGSDDINQGGAVDGGAFATLAYAWSLIPGIYAGAVTIYVNGETYTESVPMGGKQATGAFGITWQGTLSETLSEQTATSGSIGSSTVQASVSVSGASWTVGSVEESGTTDGTTGDKLVQSGQNFTSTVEAGMVVFNTTDSTQAIVTDVDSDTVLSLDTDIMVSGETYQIGWGQYTNLWVKFEDDTTTAALQGKEYLIDSNTATKLTFCNMIDAAPVSGDTFTIQDVATTWKHDSDPVISLAAFQTGVTFYRISFLDTTGSVPAYYLEGLYNSQCTLNMCRVSQSISLLMIRTLGALEINNSIILGENASGTRLVTVTRGGELTGKWNKFRSDGHVNSRCTYAFIGLASLGGSIFENSGFGFYLTNVGIFGFGGSGKHNIRNCGTGIFGSGASVATNTANVIYTNNTTDENPAGASDPSYID